MSCEVKICGFTRAEDVVAASAAGVDFLGFVLVPGSKRRTSPELRLSVPAGVKSVFVVAGMELERIQTLIETYRPDVIQLHGSEPPELARSIRGAEVWRAFHLVSVRDVEEAAAYPAARIVADSSCGGSGRTCDWELAAKLAERRPVMLAGGITPENAAAAARAGKFVGLDVAGGSESSYGVKSIEKILQIIRSVKS